MHFQSSKNFIIIVKGVYFVMITGQNNALCSQLLNTLVAVNSYTRTTTVNHAFAQLLSNINLAVLTGIQHP